MKKDKENKEYIVKFYFINKSTFSTVITEEWKDEIEKILRKNKRLKRITFGPSTDTGEITTLNMKYVNAVRILEVKNEK